MVSFLILIFHNVGFTTEIFIIALVVELFFVVRRERFVKNKINPPPTSKKHVSFRLVAVGAEAYFAYEDNNE